MYTGESFHPSVLSIRLFFLYFLLQSCWNGSLISPLEASIQRLVKLSTDITNFTFHPFSASSVPATTASRRVSHSNSLPDLGHYPGFFYFFIFFCGVADTRFSPICCRARSIVNRAVFANSDKMMRSRD